MKANATPQGGKPSEPFVADFSEGLETGLYLGLLELIDEGLIITGDETILEVNSAACRLLERDYRVLVGCPLSTLFPSEKAFLEARARLLIQGEMRGSLNVSLPGGRHRTMRFIAAARLRPGMHALILSPDYLSEQTPAQPPRRDDLWPRLAAIVNQPVLVVDAEQRISALNAAALRLLDGDRAALTGQPLANVLRLDWSSAHPEKFVALERVSPDRPSNNAAPELQARLLNGPKPGWHVLVLNAPDNLSTHTLPAPPAQAPAPRAQTPSGTLRQRNTPQHAAITAAVRSALLDNQLELHFQPLMDVRSGQVLAGEALLRWHHPSQGLTPFGRFHELVQDEALIAQLSDWALQQACQLAARWPHCAAYPKRLTVNVSASQALRGDLVARVQLALERSDLPAARLVLDLDERVLQADGEEQLARSLATLHGMGVTLAIDDFGRGLSSIPQLKRYPLQALKLHPELVAGVGCDEDSEAVVEAIATMATVLSLEVYARGVESEAQQAFLSALGCHLQQGPLFGPPMDARNFLRNLGEQPQGASPA